MTENTTTESTTETTGTALGAVERYLRFWNETDPGERERLAAATFAGGMRYHAPVALLEGPAGMARFADELRQRLGAADVVALRTPEHHHDRARLRWELRVGDRSFAAGTDVLVLDEDGRVREVTTFLDRAPEGFHPHAR